MPRGARFCPAGLPAHIIQRGNNRQAIFTSDDDLAAYAHWLSEGARRFGIAVHGWVFMTNHVHLLATPANTGSISQLMQYLGRYYVRHFNYTYARSGTLFEGRFKTSIVQEDHYFLTCLRYIELNPVRAGMVKDPGDYRWSSYRAHAFGVNVGLWTPHKPIPGPRRYNNTSPESLAGTEPGDPGHRNHRKSPALRQHRISAGNRDIPGASQQTPHLKPHSPVLLCPFTLTP